MNICNKVSSDNVNCMSLSYVIFGLLPPLNYRLLLSVLPIGVCYFCLWIVPHWSSGARFAYYLLVYFVLQALTTVSAGGCGGECVGVCVY